MLGMKGGKMKKNLPDLCPLVGLYLLVVLAVGSVQLDEVCG